MVYFQSIGRIGQYFYNEFSSLNHSQLWLYCDGNEIFPPEILIQLVVYMTNFDPISLHETNFKYSSIYNWLYCHVKLNHFLKTYSNLLTSNLAVKWLLEFNRDYSNFINYRLMQPVICNQLLNNRVIFTPLDLILCFCIFKH